MLYRDPARMVGIALLLALTSVLPSRSFGAISNAFITDIAPASFAVVAITDAPVLSASLRVFANAEQTEDITPDVKMRLTSTSLAGVHEVGMVRFDLEDLSAGADYFVLVEVQQPTGTFNYPSDGSLLYIRTASDSGLTGVSGQLALNEVIGHKIYRPNSVSISDHILVTVSVPQIGLAPLAEFASGLVAAPAAYFDLSNLTNAEGDRLELAPNQTLVLREYAGLACGLGEQNVVVRFRRAPARTSVGAPLLIREPLTCFSADTDCDGSVNVLDVQFLLNAWSRNVGDCGFNPDLDIVADGAVDILDLQSLLNRFGDSEPF